MIYGPKRDGTFVVEFKTADGRALAISLPAGETRVLKHFQERTRLCPTFREEPLRSDVFSRSGPSNLFLPRCATRAPGTPPHLDSGRGSLVGGMKRKPFVLRACGPSSQALRCSISFL
jgi:hypothetical protein